MAPTATTRAKRTGPPSLTSRASSRLPSTMPSVRQVRPSTDTCTRASALTVARVTPLSPPGGAGYVVSALRLSVTAPTCRIRPRSTVTLALAVSPIHCVVTVPSSAASAGSAVAGSAVAGRHRARLVVGVRSGRRVGRVIVERSSPVPAGDSTRTGRPDTRRTRVCRGPTATSQHPASPVQGAGGDAGQLRRKARVEADPVCAPAEPGVAVQELLQEAAGPGGEGERTTAAGLRELVVRRAQERVDAAAGEGECRASGCAEGGGHDRVDRVGHRRPARIRARNVVVEVGARSPGARCRCSHG